MESLETSGRVIWVVGAGSGMGRAAAAATARTGRVVVLSGRREERLLEVAREVEDTGGRALVLAGDATDAAWAVKAAAEIAARFGRLDEVLVASGLNAPERSWADQKMFEFEAVVATNLLAAARVIDAALPGLRARGGTVVVISSYAGWTFQPGAGVAYSASKSALVSLCRTLNQQEAEHGIRATHLCPGDVDTDFLLQRPQVPDADARAVMLSPDDIARSVMHILDAPPHIRIDELVISPLSQR